MGLASDLSSLTPTVLRSILESRESDGAILGPHPADGRNVRVKIGRYGAFLQWGEEGEDGTTTHSLPKDVGGLGGRGLDLKGGGDGAGDASSANGEAAHLGTVLGLTLETAAGYCDLPRTVCVLNELNVTAAIGPYGPYLKYNNSFASLRSDIGDVLTVDEETAVRVVTEGIINKSSKFGRGVLAELGDKDGSTVRVKEGRFGTYLNWKRVNAKLPSAYVDNPGDVPLEEAWELIQAKAGSSPSTKRGKKGTKKKKDDDAGVPLPPPPKRSLSSYLHFCAEKRGEVSERMSSLGEVSKELARLWKETEGSKDGRTKYEDLAAADKLAYEEKKAEWREECDRILAESGGKGAPKKRGRAASESTKQRRK
mmetsp:Transcript_25570/g.75404  ORF Transcript_25570/g.75404 Transcript_25570/m.75404 type:complete len:368 (-) Transcript_25570:7-1110(-)